jgi:putative oxidoreductase
MTTDIGFEILRIVVGLLFIGHGSQKLFGAFNGPGLDGATSMFQKLRIQQPRTVAVIVAMSELAGGAGLALGLVTPLACGAVAAVMMGAIVFAHWPKFWVTEEGIEYSLVNLTIATFFGFAGPGGWSLDSALGTQDLLPNPWTYLVVAALGALSVAFIASQRREQPARQEKGGDQRIAA